MKILIKGGHVVDAKMNLDKVADILIEDGKIAEIGENIEFSGGDIIYAEGKYVFPGFVDAHCHLRDPGYEYKEDIESGTRSAAVGGFTSVACMPNTNPVIDNQSVIKYIINKSKQEGMVNVYPIGAISKGLEGKELSEIGELKFAGAVALSDDGKPLEDASLMKKAMEYSSMFDITIISHCEEPSLSAEGVMNEGYQSTILGLKGIPSAAEEIMVARDIILSEYTKVPVHIAHVSTELSVELIRHAKKRGVKVTCETCPHYFVLTDEACSDFNTFAKVNPPLRTKKDVDAIIEGLKDGTIDIIATDHAPHHIDEKNVEFNIAANGISGFETAIPLAITYLVKPGHLTLKQLVEKMCVNPSNLLGLSKGTLEVGSSADITIVDLDEEFLVDVQKFKSKGKNSPFDGYKLSGRVYYTIVNGKILVREKVLL
ncbi:MAG TPA: dihydroorotase [Ruminiclostridium sp.]|uniref:Dihydroorotase n=2 Tax=Acetivibrio saccincola TaxID=1677857 RepID=A0A2K9E5R8_9FIRM|nr:dihydroorotase [Acetivibrio saccincola]HAA42902.1 dihydroorotase [Ruminiclostridium sp.]AUG57718.1 Dihydroorotase [Acetivibrio saccincola]NLW27877.1 dihydroorotase [Acetivibrio saccincola]PQQ67609.1 dihydroorotase [Acetivibrio saccincola]HOA98119.1 dihydroorotase [Acetivibrio saccincola]